MNKPELPAQCRVEPKAQTEPEQELSALGTLVPMRWRSIVTIVWLGQAIAIVASGAAAYALIWYITITTESPLMLMLGTVFFFLPMAIIGPFSGTIVDRYSRKAIMIIADLGIAVSMLVMAFIIMAGMISIPVVFIAIAARSICTAFHQPAMLAAMPLLVPSRHLVRINTLDQAVQAAGNIVSPAIGILFFETIGLQAALFADVGGATFACLTLAAVTIPAAHMAKEQRQTVRADMLAGLRIVRDVKGLTALFVLLAIGTAAFMPLAALYTLMTYSHFGGGGFEAALVEAVFGSGFLLGSIILTIWGGGKRLMYVVGASLVLQGATFLVIGFLPSSMFVTFVVISGISAVFGSFFNGPLNSIVQRCVSPERLGRVMALMGVVTSLAAPVGLLIAAPLAEVIGITPWFILGGAALISIAVIAALMPTVRTLDIRNQQQP